MTHRATHARYISFLIVPEHKSEPIGFKLHINVVAGILITVAAILVLTLIGFVTYWKLASIAIDYGRIREDNEKLIKSLQQIEKLKEDLGRMQSYEKKLRSSMSGYVTIEDNALSGNSPLQDNADVSQLPASQQRSIFNFIPSIIPSDGFIGREFETSTLLTDNHMGIDIAGTSGAPIVATANGVVVFAGHTIDGGNTLVIEHEFGFMTVFKHNLTNLVTEFERVEKGQLIGLLGNTGKITSGPHVHYEVWRNGTPLNPVVFIKARNQL
jgi:murein DD-endopeptidase MepM/ murein hydrolase activator NlpD